ncbi:hypothetical protein ACHAXR_011252 [Thalassiosira sp. AJA248-18]
MTDCWDNPQYREYLQPLGSGSTLKGYCPLLEPPLELLPTDLMDIIFYTRSIRALVKVHSLLLALITLVSANSAKATSSRDLSEGNDNLFEEDVVCNQSRNLEEFPQWREEVGYWLGELSFYGPNGEPNESASWNYPYDNYKGFITGNISGASYRQRNVFLYPPQMKKTCEDNNSVVGDGVCGDNGNSKIFFADQSITGKSFDGTIEGTADGIFDRKTTLVGEDNAVLYQIFYQGKLFQSQLTTMSGDGRRTRSAHGFNPFLADTAAIPTSSSFYRERKVERKEFYAALEETLEEYGLLTADTCTRDSSGKLVDKIVGGFGACLDHLEESFDEEWVASSITQESSISTLNSPTNTTRLLSPTDPSVMVPTPMTAKQSSSSFAIAAIILLSWIILSFLLMQLDQISKLLLSTVCK